MKKSIWRLAFCFAFITAAGCNKKAEIKRPAPRVKIAHIVQRDVPIYIDTIGQAIAPVTINIRPQVAGKLIAAYIQQGAVVNEGDLLYSIDPRPYVAILEEAKAQLLHDEALLYYAEETVKRYKTIVEDEFISILTYEQYESNAKAAKAQVELDKAAIWAAQINVDFCNIYAPAAGKISYFNVDVGNILVVDDPNALTVLRPLSPIDITFSLPQQYFEMIRKEDGNEGFWKFKAILPEKPKEPFEGIAYFLDNQIDQDTGTILLKGRLPNSKKELWPGEFVKVKVLYKTAPQALIAPPGAILMGKDGAYLYVVDKDNKALARQVKVLMRADEYIAFESPEIAAGEVVVTDGQINLASGVTVNIANETK